MLRTGAKALVFFTPAHFASLHKRALNGTKPAGTGFVITKALCSHGNLLTIDGLRPWGTITQLSPVGFPRCLFVAVLSFGAVALTQPSLINFSNALPRVLFSVLGVRCSCPHTLALERGHACGFANSRFYSRFAQGLISFLDRPWGFIHAAVLCFVVSYPLDGKGISLFSLADVCHSPKN